MLCVIQSIDTLLGKIRRAPRSMVVAPEAWRLVFRHGIVLNFDLEFMFQADFLKVYVQYVQNYNVALETLEKLRQIPEFVAWLQVFYGIYSH